MKRPKVDERDLQYALGTLTRPRHRYLVVDRTNPVWQRLRAACCNHSSIDVDEHTDHVYAAVVALRDGCSPFTAGGARDAAHPATPAPGKVTK